MDQDSKLLYQFASNAFERVKELNRLRTNNPQTAANINFSRELYLSILNKVPQFLVKTNRNVPHFYYFYGMVLYYLNKEQGLKELKDNAVRLIKKAINDTSQNEAIGYMKELVELLLNEKKYTESLTYCYQLIKHLPRDIYYYQLTASTLLKLKREDEAIELYKRAIRVDQYNFEFHTALGKLYLSRKEYDLALKMFLTSKELNQQHPENYIYIGKIFLIRNRKALAGSNFKTAIARKLYSHERYLKESRHKQGMGKLFSQRDDDRHTTLFLFECYINLIKCDENYYNELREIEKKLFEKGYLSPENIEQIKRRYKIG